MMMRFRSLAGAVVVLGLAIGPRPASAGAAVANLENFYKRLESIGLETSYIRALGAKFPTYFSLYSKNDPPGKWNVGSRTMEIHTDLKDPSSNNVKVDLPVNPDMITVLHEFTHAEYGCVLNGGFTEPTEKGAAGTPQNAHYEAWYYWKNDIRSQGLIVHYSNLKAEEICGYYLSGDLLQVYDVVNYIVAYNKMGGLKLEEVEAAYGDATKLEDELVLPPPNGKPYPSAYEKPKLEPRWQFGNAKPIEEIQFQNKPVGKFTENPYLKRDLYLKGLGLKAPKTTGELLDRLNTIRNPWIDQIRLDVLNVRRMYKKLPAVDKLPSNANPRKPVRPAQTAQN